LTEPRGPRWWETLLFWLNLWTPPRGVDPKPPPYRLILGIFAGLLVVGIPAGLIIGGAIGDEKGRARERDESALRARQLAEHRRLIRDQRLVRGRVSLSGARGPAARERLIAGVERAVAAEARRRHAAGELETRIRFPRARCRELPERQPRHLSMECVAVTSDVTGGEGDKVGHLGYPFLVLLSLDDGRYGFCKTNPNPGEGASRFGTTPPLSPECSGRG
jgi:hypothetical protein